MMSIGEPKGDTQIIVVSRAKAMKTLAEEAGKVGGSSQHALSLSLSVERIGIGRQQRLDVMVVGTPEAVEKTLKDMGTYLGKLQDGGLFMEKVLLKNGKLEVPKYGPLELVGADKLRDVLALAKITTDQGSKHRESA